MEFSVGTHEGARLEVLEIQGIVIKVTPPLRVGLEEDLKSPIEKETIHIVGTNAPPGPVACFDDEDIAPCFLKLRCGGEAGKARANNDDFMVFHGLT